MSQLAGLMSPPLDPEIIVEKTNFVDCARAWPFKSGPQFVGACAAIADDFLDPEPSYNSNDAFATVNIDWASSPGIDRDYLALVSAGSLIYFGERAAFLFWATAASCRQGKCHWLFVPTPKAGASSSLIAKL